MRKPAPLVVASSIASAMDYRKILLRWQIMVWRIMVG
jgi:hypothetical protein